MAKQLVVLIPAYNEAKTIGTIIQSIPEIIAGCEVTVLVVNDGSTDQTQTIAEAHHARVVSHPKNFGVGRAFQTGLEEALHLKADVLVNIDADGQYSPTDIPALLTPILKDEADFVVADRFTDPRGGRRMPEHMPPDRFTGNRLMSWLISVVVGQRFSDVSSGFRAYSRDVLHMLNLTGRFTYTQESFIDLVSKGARVTSVPTAVQYFPGRTSRVAPNLLAYGMKTLKIILTAFRDYRPLFFFALLSVPPLLVCLGTGTFLAIHYWTTGSFSPYKAVGFIGIYFSAVTLALWMIGFLADMFTRIRLNQEKTLYYLKTMRYEQKK